MLMTADVISRARSGDGEAFRQLTQPHLRELHVHCYLMLGSLQDAEDALLQVLAFLESRQRGHDVRSPRSGFGWTEVRRSQRAAIERQPYFLIDASRPLKDLSLLRVHGHGCADDERRAESDR
jgi:hypothetical protein